MRRFEMMMIVFTTLIITGSVLFMVAAAVKEYLPTELEWVME